MKLNLKKPIIFFDLETTGTDISKDRIVEICYIKIFPDGREIEYTKRINPGMHIPEGASAVHGIYDEDVKDCPSFKEVAKEIASDFEGEVVVLTIHTTTSKNKDPAYIEENFSDSKMLFVYDVALDKYRDMYFTLLGGTNSYPRTLVLDENGVITFATDGGMEYEDLVEQIEAIKNK